MHAVVHGASQGGTPAPHVQAPVHDHVHGLDAPVGTGWLASLFSSHRDGDPDCRLFDQASHGSVLPAMAVLSLPMALSSLVDDSSRGEALARWAALFDARGPPLTR